MELTKGMSLKVGIGDKRKKKMNAVVTEVEVDKQNRKMLTWDISNGLTIPPLKYGSVPSGIEKIVKVNHDPFIEVYAVDYCGNEWLLIPLDDGTWLKRINRCNNCAKG